MIYHRPTADSMRKWAEEVGDESYNFDDMLPYFKKSCHYTPPDLSLYVNMTNTEATDAFDPSGGPLEISFSNIVDVFGIWAQKAFSAVGMDQIEGLNSGKLLGAAWATSTIKPTNAHRSSSESSFLQGAFKSGLGPTVYIDTMAQKILFDSNKAATGVQVSTAGSFGTNAVQFTLNARKEVIVSAGALQSPQLLMVSGIGACEELDKFGIDCINNLPDVGQNLQDHGLFGTSHQVNIPTASAVANNQTLAALAIELYLQEATGPLSIFGAGYYGWEKLPEPYRSHLSEDALQALSSIPGGWPELEWLPVNAYFGDGANFITADPLDGHNYATLATAIVAPFSPGYDPQWLGDSTDMELAIQAFKRQREVWDELVRLEIADPEEFYPGKHVQTDEQIRQHITQAIFPLYHVFCSCKMGRRDDPMAVLDSAARVYGVHNLRVVDASSFPLLTPGHPQAIVYALAEKIAEDIVSGR